MERRHWAASLTFVMAILAGSISCNPTSTPGPPSPTRVPPTGTAIATRTSALPSITPTSTPTLAFTSPKDQRLNCRFGPGTAYAIIGALETDQSAQIAGRTADESWWYIHDPGNPGGFCWVAASLTETSGDTSGIPVVPVPSVTVTKIEMAVNPPHRSVTCDAFPQTFYVTAEVTANGPAIVMWRWEVSTGETSEESTLVFTESGTQILENYYLAPGANDYVIRLHVLSPNDTGAQINFRVDCSPQV